jgi:hypothetical protein
MGKKIDKAVTEPALPSSNSKTITMQRKTRVFFAPIAILLVLTLLIYQLPARPESKPAPDSSCCKEKTSCSEPGKPAADDLMMENLSRQFILVSPIN